MAAGSFGFRKTVRKSVYWSGHGTHSVCPGLLAKMQRERLHRPKPEMYGSVSEAFEAALRERKQKHTVVGI